MGFYFQKNEGTRILSDIQEVQMTCSLNDSIEELKIFNDEKLFPYISALLAELERVVAPSPFVY